MDRISKFLSALESAFGSAIHGLPSNYVVGGPELEEQLRQTGMTDDEALKRFANVSSKVWTRSRKKEILDAIPELQDDIAINGYPDEFEDYEPLRDKLNGINWSGFLTSDLRIVPIYVAHSFAYGYSMLEAMEMNSEVIDEWLHDRYGTYDRRPEFPFKDIIRIKSPLEVIRDLPKPLTPTASTPWHADGDHSALVLKHLRVDSRGNTPFEKYIELVLPPIYEDKG